MPLKCYKQTCEMYYTEHIKSDIVSDIIVEGRTEYPVIDLALDHLYDSAQQLLQKGYKCLHGDTAHIAHEAALLLCEIATPHIRSLIHGDENLPDIEHALLSEMDERMQNNPDEYATFITLVVHSLSLIDNISVSKNVIPYIRKHMPELYDDFIALGDFDDMETFLHFDSKFVEDYMDDLRERNMISQFTEENRIGADQATAMLYDIFDYMDLDTFDTLQPSLFSISRTCPGLFPDHFTCDVVILFMIGRFRNFSSGSDNLRNMFCEEDDLFLDEYDDKKELIRHYMSLYFPLLHFHMKPGYTFDRVAHILITCMNPLTEIYCMPMASDFALLDAATHHATNCLGIDKLPISSSTLKTSIEEWKIKLPVYAEESRPEYYDGKELLETYLPDAEKIASWFYDNCDVQ
ncbi:MAG: hypothetical protein ACI4EF_11335 [Coprococcus sp.]